MTLITENVQFPMQQLPVDRDRCVVRGVKLLGLSSKNGRRYTQAALESARSMYEGARVNLNHPKDRPDAPRGYEDRFGRIRNANVRSDGMYGDLYFNPKHSIAEQFLWDCQYSPDSMGLSHNVDVDAKRDKDGTLVIESIIRVRSVDLVADPATTQSIFESEGHMSIALSAIVKELPEERRKSVLEFIEASGDITFQAEDTEKATKLLEAMFAGQQPEQKKEEETEKSVLEALAQRVQRMERRELAFRLLNASEIPATETLLEELESLDEKNMRSRIAELPPSARHRSRPVVEFDSGSTPGAPAADLKDFVSRCKTVV